MEGDLDVSVKRGMLCGPLSSMLISHDNIYVVNAFKLASNY
jgi:hypothetical protein